MKFAKCVAVLATLTLGLSLSALAKDKNQGKFTLADEAQVGSTQLKPGEYKVQWEGSGDAVQVTILKGKNVVTTTTAKLVEQPNAAQADAVTLDTGANPKTLKEIDFGNRKEALVFTGSQPSAGQ